MTATAGPDGSDDLLLPAGTRLIHIGPPKTGTTYLQGAFHGNRQAVSAQGVHYAGPTRQPVAAVLSILGLSNTRTGEVPPIAKWRDLVDEIRNAGERRVLLSSERLARAKPETIRTIVDDLGPDRVHVAVTLRPLAKSIPSQWQQTVQAGLRTSFDQFLEQIFGDQEERHTKWFWYPHRHDQLIARWAEVVGPQNVTVIALDERDHDMVLRVFERLLGLRAGTLVADGDRTNRSMTWAEIEIVRAFNEQFFAAGLSRPLHTKVMAFGAATRMKAREPGPGEARIETPQWALDRTAGIAREMVDAITASGVRIVGDPEHLRPVLTSRLVDGVQPDPEISPDLAATVAMSVLRASGLVPDPDGQVTRTSVEPIALARVSTLDMVGIVGRRIVTAAGRRTRRLVGRSR